MCGPDDRFFAGAQRCSAILEPSACDAFRAWKRLYCAVCAVFMCVLFTPIDFLEFFPGNRNHHHFSDDVGCHEPQLVCHWEVGNCQVEDEDEDAASGFPSGSLQYFHLVFRSTL